MWSWGNNNFGQVGNDSTTLAPSPVAIAGLGAQAAVVAAGPYHSLAIDVQGRIWAWGNNWYGQLGLGDSGYGTNRTQPVQVSIPSSSKAIAVAAGSYHSLAVLSDRTLWAWGNNDYGQLGLGDAVTGTSRELPTLVDRLWQARARRTEHALLSTLTGREREILCALAEGGTTAEIAGALGISRATVQTHVKNVLCKLGVHSKVEAVGTAWRAGLAVGSRSA